MGTWSNDQLRRIAEADDLHISPFREDGVTYGTPTWIWSIAVGDDLYVRAYYGQNSRWYQAAMRQTAGRITAAGITKEVTFEPFRDSQNRATREQWLTMAATSKIPGFRRLLFVLGLAMPHGHALSGANNNTAKGIDSMKISQGNGLLMVQHSNAHTDETKFHETFTLSYSLCVFPFP
jgi:hypothetical protein